MHLRLLGNGSEKPNTRKVYTKRAHFNRITERPTFGSHILLSVNSDYILCFIVICLYTVFLSRTWLVRSVHIEYTLSLASFLLKHVHFFYLFCLATVGLKMVETFAICRKGKYTYRKYRQTSISSLSIIWLFGIYTCKMKTFWAFSVLGLSDIWHFWNWAFLALIHLLQYLHFCFE